jgi:hypothetical protein
MSNSAKWCIAACLLSAAVYLGCKKETAQEFTVTGQVIDGRSGSPMAGVTVTVAQQLLNNGIYNLSYSDAASTTTDASGNYTLKWSRENANGIKVYTALTKYIRKTVYINPTSLRTDTPNHQDITIYPEAFISVRYYNQPPSATTDYMNFRFENANFDCTCCGIDPVSYSGDIDTTITCRLYGDTWLRYRTQLTTADVDTTRVDSIYVPPFDTVHVDVTY